MKLVDAMAVLFGFRPKIEIESDQEFSKAVSAQSNGTEELAAARAKLEACRDRIHSRVAKIERAVHEAREHERASVAG